MDSISKPDPKTGKVIVKFSVSADAIKNKVFYKSSYEITYNIVEKTNK
jgi:hypothetical protein